MTHRSSGEDEVWRLPKPDAPAVDPGGVVAPPPGAEGASDGESVSHKAATGVLWLTSQKWVVRILGLVTIAILTRFLSPEDFGLVAAASTVLPFFYLLSDLGFAAYIVQVKRTDQRMLSTAFWFSASASVVLCVALVAIAPVLGVIFRDARVVPILQVLSVWVLFTAVASVPTALLRRRMQFATLAKQGASAAVIAQIVAIAMVFLNMGVWALVGQSLASVVVAAVWACAAARWRPSFQFDRREFIVMARFGGQVLGVEFVAMLRAWAETAIISAVLGMAAVGFLSIAQRLVAIVQELTGSALVPVTTVAFARVRDDPARLRNAYLRALRMTYAVMSPPLVVVAVAAPLIIPILFGDGWTDSFQVAQVLAIAATLTVGAALDHGLFYGVGRPGLWFGYALIVDALTVATTAVAVQWGLVPVALGFLGVALLSTIARWFLVARLASMRGRVVAAPFGFLLVSVTLSGLAGWGVVVATSALPDLLSVMLAGIAVAAVHFVVVWLLARSVIDEGMQFVRRSRVGKRLTARMRGLWRTGRPMGAEPRHAEGREER